MSEGGAGTADVAATPMLERLPRATVFADGLPGIGAAALATSRTLTSLIEVSVLATHSRREGLAEIASSGAGMCGTSSGTGMRGMWARVVAGGL